MTLGTRLCGPFCRHLNNQYNSCVLWDGSDSHPNFGSATGNCAVALLRNPLLKRRPVNCLQASGNQYRLAWFISLPPVFGSPYCEFGRFLRTDSSSKVRFGSTANHTPSNPSGSLTATRSIGLWPHYRAVVSDAVAEEKLIVHPLFSRAMARTSARLTQVIWSENLDTSPLSNRADDLQDCLCEIFSPLTTPFLLTRRKKFPSVASAFAVQSARAVGIDPRFHTVAG